MAYDSSKIMRSKTLCERADMILEIMNSRCQTPKIKRMVVASCAIYEKITMISEAAFKIMRTNSELRKQIKNSYIDCTEKRNSRLIFEHILPTNVFYNWLSNPKNLTKRKILNVLPLYQLAIITVDEDEKLTKLKLRQSMPETWDLSKDPLMRYHKAGIKLHEW